jgi:uncharacterized membrane protein
VEVARCAIFPNRSAIELTKSISNATFFNQISQIGQQINGTAFSLVPLSFCNATVAILVYTFTSRVSTP